MSDQDIELARLLYATHLTYTITVQVVTPIPCSMPTLHTESTPNPNSIKITTDGGPFIEDGLVSLTSKEEADAHPLGRLLFAVDGIANVLILPQFVTISKSADTDWGSVLPKVKEILNNHLEDVNA